MHDDARVWREIALRELPHRFRRDPAAPHDVFVQVIRLPDVMVVQVELIGDAAESTDELQAVEDLGRPHRRLQLVAEPPVMDPLGAAEAYAAGWFRFITGVPFYSVYLLGVGRDPNDEGS